MIKIDGAMLLFLFLTILLSGVGTVFRKVGVDAMPNPLQFQIMAAFVYGALGLAAWISYTQQPVPDAWPKFGVAMNLLSLLFNAAASLTFMKLIGMSNNVGLMTGLTSLGVIVTLVLSMIFLKEAVTTKGIIGMILMLLGAFITSKK